jgi:ribosomal protein S18 acetylase RimI-like enzyme
MPKIVLRPLAAADRDAYRKIRLESIYNFPEHFSTTFDEAYSSPNLFHEYSMESTGFVMGAFNIRNQLKGTCRFTRELRLKSIHRGEIEHLYISPDLSGAGVGNNLFRFTLERAFNIREIELVTLNVGATNSRAVKLFTRSGFVQYGKVNHYFKNDNKYSDQLFMYLARNSFMDSINKD